MSGDGFAAKRRSEKAAKSPIDEKNQRSLMDELKGQAGSMAGMAGMFIATIWLATWQLRNNNTRRTPQKDNWVAICLPRGTLGSQKPVHI